MESADFAQLIPLNFAIGCGHIRRNRLPDKLLMPRGLFLGN
jgi:hypothetical protein